VTIATRLFPLLEDVAEVLISAPWFEGGRVDNRSARAVIESWNA
jgi:hypothetical protein